MTKPYRQIKPASTYYRRHNEQPPKEHPIHTFGVWRRAMVATGKPIGYGEWLKEVLSEREKTTTKERIKAVVE